MTYVLHILVIISIYTILATSLNLISGTLGVISIAHAAFYALGAYATALLRTQSDASFITVVVFSFLVSATAGMGLALPAVRLRGTYFLVGTFAFQVLIQSLANNWTSVTGGPVGISSITPGSILTWSPDAPVEFFILVLTVMILAVTVVYRITKSPLGRTFRAIREDEVLAACLGKHVGWYKLQVFTISCGIAGIAGCLYAQHATFVTPDGFTIRESILILTMVVLGGRGSVAGAALGATILVLVPESLRFLGLPTAISAELRLLVYGIALVVCMLWRPEGLIGEYASVKEAKPK